MEKNMNKLLLSILGEGVENLDMKIENICESPVRRKPKSLIVVVTEGCLPVQCYSIGEKLKTVSVPVPKLDKVKIKVRHNFKQHYKGKQQLLSSQKRLARAL